MLGDGRRDAPVRQRTLEAAIGWNYDLLRPGLIKRALRRLAVFPGSFDAAAAEAVVGKEVLPVLARLVDASLVAADPPRYRLLMTVRTFAHERLSEFGEEEQARQRHRDTFLTLAESAAANMSNAGLGPGLDPAAGLEQENFLAALRWSLDRGDGGPALAIACWLSWFWFRIGFLRDGRALLEQSMAAADPSDPLWPRALFGRAALACASGSADASTATDDAVAAAERARDGEMLAITLRWRGYETPSLHVRLRSPSGRVTTHSFRLPRQRSERRRIQLEMPVPAPQLWSPDAPPLRRRDHPADRGRVVQRERRRIGLRSVEVKRGTCSSTTGASSSAARRSTRTCRAPAPPSRARTWTGSSRT